MLRGRAPQCNDGALLVPVIPALRRVTKILPRCWSRAARLDAAPLKSFTFLV
jgi:hypothetical protein